MQFHQLKRSHGHKSAKRVARGGKRGKTAGRGTKGQKARAGHRMRPEMRDIIKKYPKLRGYRFKSFTPKPFPVNLEVIEKAYAGGETVSPETLVAKKLAKNVGGRPPKIKILGTGALSKKITVSGCTISASAKKAVVAAGGAVNE